MSYASASGISKCKTILESKNGEMRQRGGLGEPAIYLKQELPPGQSSQSIAQRLPC